MTKMLWELKAPLAIAKAKEDMSLNNIFKYLRYYRMYLARFNWKLLFNNTETDITKRIENLLFWRGKVALVKDLAYGVVVCEIDETRSVYDPNGKIIKVSVSAENGYKKSNLKVGEDVIILQADETGYAPVLYIWAIANEIIDKEDIIKQQDNMLRKPILVTGEGEELDNAMVKVMNILSGIQFINVNPKAKNTNVMLDKPAEVLNLQVGNAYKGSELWDSRKHFEELICDYLGYTTVKNEKKERMNTDEVNNDNSVGNTFYKSALYQREMAVKNFEGILKLEKNLEELKEVNNYDKETDVQRINDK